MQKLQYLRASLSGLASDAIASLETSDVNYQIAWNSLTDRYDKRRIIINAHVEAIMGLPSMSKENASQLRQIADGITKHINALTALRCPTNSWDILLIFIITSKLDPLTAREWRASLTSPELPTFKEFIDFIKHRCETLEATTKYNALSLDLGNAQIRSKIKLSNQAAHVATNKIKCILCSGNHLMYACGKFKELFVAQRFTEMRKRRVCFNCLKTTEHMSNTCKAGSCKHCGARHNTLLHAATDERAEQSSSAGKDDSSSATSSTTVMTHGAIAVQEHPIMLSAIVHAFDRHNKPTSCRVLLDSGSQANFISRAFLNKLRLKANNVSIAITGINNACYKGHQSATLKLQSRLNSFEVSIECIVTNQITGKIPQSPASSNSFKLPRNIRLADPAFNIPADIDVLIGAEFFWALLCIGQIKASWAHPTLQKTRFGWIIAGRVTGSRAAAFHVRVLHSAIRLSNA